MYAFSTRRIGSTRSVSNPPASPSPFLLFPDFVLPVSLEPIYIDLNKIFPETYPISAKINDKKIGICIAPTQPFQAALGAESRVGNLGNTADRQTQWALTYCHLSQSTANQNGKFTATAGIRTLRIFGMLPFWPLCQVEHPLCRPCFFGANYIDLNEIFPVEVSSFLQIALDTWLQSTW
jgi:hypothetical protein